MLQEIIRQLVCKKSFKLDEFHTLKHKSQSRHDTILLFFLDVTDNFMFIVSMTFRFISNFGKF